MDHKDLENRFTYHAPKDDQATRYETIRKYAFDFAEIINTLCPDSRETVWAINCLDNAVMWANAAIARNE